MVVNIVIEGIFPGERLKFWDFCCGAGRHTILLSSLGYDIYGSDVSENGIEITKRKLVENNLQAHLKISDMTEKPFDKTKFQGSLIFRMDDSGENLLIINRLPLEDYVYAVVGSECIPSWPMGVQRIQAIISRTYAV